MTKPETIPILKPEIITSPSISNLVITPVGTGMFSVSMQVIVIVRFPAEDSPGSIDIDPAAQQTSVSTSSSELTTKCGLTYGNGELPTAFDGEAEGFQAFVQVHGYPPPTREVLIQWATNSQGGA